MAYKTTSNAERAERAWAARKEAEWMMAGRLSRNGLLQVGSGAHRSLRWTLSAVEAAWPHLSRDEAREVVAALGGEQRGRPAVRGDLRPTPQNGNGGG